MTRVPIKLEDRHTRLPGKPGRLIDAFLCLDMPADSVQKAAEDWRPDWDAGIQRRAKLGLPKLEYSHWDWSSKANCLSLPFYRSLAIACENSIQGLMLVKTDGYVARLPPDRLQPIVYVDYLQVARWNNKDLAEIPRLGAAGSFLMEGAARLSLDKQYKGRLGLHSLKGSESFYHGLGMQDVEIECQDRHALELHYFEWSSSQASAFLNAR